MSHWSLDDIPWQDFDASKVRPEHLSLARAACMVEHNGDDYARYLCEVFHGDAEFQTAAVAWAAEEVQHGMALRKWAELADPTFDFTQSFSMFTDGYKLPVAAMQSVRGSRCGELLSRCVVESVTSTYYSALKDASEEPVLKAICAKIAADEFRHYQLFYRYLKHYQQQDRIGLLKRLRIAIGRMLEGDDDELAYAFFSAHRNMPDAYDRQTFARRYLACTCRLYTKEQSERLTAMILKAVGIKPHGWFSTLMKKLGWGIMRLQSRRLAGYVPQAAA